MELAEEWLWQGRRIRWGRAGSGPPVVFGHGTPWSAQVWRAQAEALSHRFTVSLWDMPGYGQSSKDAGHDVSLAVQGQVLAGLLEHWGLDRPHVVAHDIGGAVALRAHLLHGAGFGSLALVDVVALAPWGSDFFRLVRDNPAVFAALPAPIHAGVVRAYVQGAAHTVLSPAHEDLVTSPWLDPVGQAAFYRQIAQAEQAHTDEIEPSYSRLRLPVLVVWGTRDSWIPVERAHRLTRLIPGAQLRLIEDAGHLVQFDQPEQLATTLQDWLVTRARG